MSLSRPVVIALAAAAAASLLTACGSASAQPSAATSAAPTSTATAAAASPSPTSSNPYGTTTVDPPGPNDPVLTVTGGSHGSTAFTLAQLEELGTTTITIDEPFVKQRLAFTGVPMSAVLDKAGIAGSARITTKALNDYEYADVASAFTGSNALIATRRGDGPVPFDAGGPIRIVFPDGSPLSTKLDAWNWSLSSIRLTNGG